MTIQNSEFRILVGLSWFRYGERQDRCILLILRRIWSKRRWLPRREGYTPKPYRTAIDAPKRYLILKLHPLRSSLHKGVIRLVMMSNVDGWFPTKERCILMMRLKIDHRIDLKPQSITSHPPSWLLSRRGSPTHDKSHDKQQRNY